MGSFAPLQNKQAPAGQEKTGEHAAAQKEEKGSFGSEESFPAYLLSNARRYAGGFTESDRDLTFFTRSRSGDDSTQAGTDFCHIAARPGLRAPLVIQRCSKGVSPCSCSACEEEAGRDRGMGGEENEQQPEEEMQSMEPDQSIEQSSDGEASETAVAEPGAEEAVSAEAPVQQLIVDDSATDISSGQMKKTAFLEQLKAEICQTIEPVLAGAGQTSEGCPYLTYWFNLYQNREAAQIEQVIKRYAPDTADATTAAAYISIITQRALRSAQNWARTGKLTGIPEGVSADLPGEAPATSGNQASAGNAVLMHKAKQGGARTADDPQNIQNKLGEGRALESSVRSRMESAFGTSFSHVRTHTDGTASGLSGQVNARAFTVGDHVAFGAGEYRPGTLIGDALIAHELAHVVQQRGAEKPAGREGWGNAGYEALEQDADQAALGVIGSLWNGLKSGVQNILPQLRAGLSLQKCSSNSTAPTSVSIRAVPQPPGSLLSVLPAGVPNNAGPNHLNFGEYSEFIGWTTTGRNGFIVQELVNTYSAAACPGSPAPAAFSPTPHYWEAWSVDGSGSVTPIVGAVNDIWYRPRRPNTSGNWSMSANVYWTTSLDPAAHFAARNPAAPDAHDLQSTATAPTNLGSSLLTRNARGTWDCTGAHAG